jgi:hypothetical protein
MHHRRVTAPVQALLTAQAMAIGHPPTQIHPSTAPSIHLDDNIFLHK